jgi:hypothetical protein
MSGKNLSRFSATETVEQIEAAINGADMAGKESYLTGDPFIKPVIDEINRIANGDGWRNHERTTTDGYTTAYLDALRLAAQDFYSAGGRVDYLLEHRPGGSLLRVWCSDVDWATIQQRATQ